MTITLLLPLQQLVVRFALKYLLTHLYILCSTSLYTMPHEFTYYAPQVYIRCSTRSLIEPTKLGTKVALFSDTCKSPLHLPYYKLIINHIPTTHVISPKLQPLKSALSPKLSHPIFAVSPKFQPLKSALSPKLLHPVFAVSPKFRPLKSALSQAQLCAPTATPCHLLRHQPS